MDSYSAEMRRAAGWAEAVLRFQKNAFLDQVEAGQVRMDGQAYLPALSHWFRLSGYRLPGDTEGARQAALRAVSQWLRAVSSAGGDAAFLLEKRGGEVKVSYGAGAAGGERAFQTHLPECLAEAGGGVRGGYRFQGLATGTLSGEGLADLVAGARDLTNCYVACLAIPVSPSEVRQREMDNWQGISWLEKHRSFQRVYGNATRRVDEIPMRPVIQAIEVLKEEKKFLEDSRGAGLVRTAVRFGAGTRDEYEKLAAWLRGCAAVAADAPGYEPVRCFAVNGGGGDWQSCLAIPALSLEWDGGQTAHPLTLQAIPAAASFCLPPFHSWEGFFVRNGHVDESALQLFPPVPAVSGIHLGSVEESGLPACIPAESLLCHGAVFGACGTGKTTTVIRLLTGLYRERQIPFVVLEAAKKEYASLVGQIPELRVYTPGADGLPLLFNPLEPEEGILIENHVAAVVRALVAATGGEHPIPEAHEGLLKQTYQEFGWQYGQLAYRDPAKPFPTFQNALEGVDRYIGEHARYGPEVRQNLTAALKLRSETMGSGALGRLFSCAGGMTARELLAAPTVIELADFSEQATAFLMNILLFRFQSYASHLPPERKLRRLIVVEEAHNIFQKTLLEESGRGQNNRALEKLLAEIRSSGTGLLISDQRPSAMPEALMANTAVKILHAMESEEDRRTAGGPMDLTEYQCRRLRDFRPGECVISVRGEPGVQHTRILSAERGAPYTAACLLCSSRFRCRRQGVERLLDGMEPERVAFHVARIRANPYQTELVAQRIDQMLRDLQVTAAAATRRCLLGVILARSEGISFQESRVILTAYAKHLDTLRG